MAQRKSVALGDKTTAESGYIKQVEIPRISNLIAHLKPPEQQEVIILKKKKSEREETTKLRAKINE